MLCQPLRGQDAGPDPRLCAGAVHGVDWRKSQSSAGEAQRAGKTLRRLQSTAPRPSGGAAAVRARREAEGEGGQGKAPGAAEGPWAASRWLSAGDAGPVPGSGRSPGGGNGNPLQCSCLGHPMDRGAWRITVHGGRRE